MHYYTLLYYTLIYTVYNCIYGLQAEEGRKLHGAKWLDFVGPGEAIGLLSWPGQCRAIVSINTWNTYAQQYNTTHTHTNTHTYTYIYIIIKTHFPGQHTRPGRICLLFSRVFGFPNLGSPGPLVFFFVSIFFLFKTIFSMFFCFPGVLLRILFSNVRLAFIFVKSNFGSRNTCSFYSILQCFVGLHRLASTHQVR